jgi:hypothetical protein
MGILGLLRLSKNRFSEYMSSLATLLDIYIQAKCFPGQ